MNPVCSTSESCAKCKTPRACVLYHHALCLLNRAHANDAQRALDLLSRAVELKPNEVRYQRQYARCAQSLGLVEVADNASAVLLALTDFQDAEIVAQHSRFLSECKLDAQQAVHYQAQPPQPPSGLLHPEIKLIIYDFDETLTYANLWNKVNGDLVCLNLK